MTAPVLEWTYRVGYPETDVLTTTDDVLVTALVRRYGGRWAVELWTSRDDEDDAPEHRISRAILDIDVPRADPIPPAVLVAAETWLREHVQGIAWPGSVQEQIALEAPALAILRRVSSLLALAGAAPSWDALSPEQNCMATVLALLFGDIPGEDAARLRAGVLAAADAEPEITDADAARTCDRLGIDVTAWAAEIRAKVAERVAMTDADKEEQRRSFAAGNVALSNPDVTRAVVDEAADRMAEGRTAPSAQREPVAGWLCEGGNSYSLGDVEVFRYCDVWWYRVGARIRVGPHAGLREAKLAAEDAAAEVLRARVEALGYRMVRT